MAKTMILCLSVLLSSCASLDVVPLDAKAEMALDGAAPGFRIPRMTPYLVVAQLPARPTTAPQADPAAAPVVAPPKVKKHGGLPPPPKKPGRVPQAPVVAGPAGPPGSPGGDPAPTTADSASAPSTPAGSGSDTTFTASSDTFVMRIIYLPDYEHAVAVRARSGLFGSSSLQMSLQNGMLTSLNGKVDNSKAADVAVAALSALTTIATGGASKAATAAAPGGKPRVAADGTIAKTPKPPLRPGVYAFVPISGLSPLGVCAVAYFTPKGIEPPTDASKCDRTKPMHVEQ
jgi:hypothetical protein